MSPSVSVTSRTAGLNKLVGPIGRPMRGLRVRVCALPHAEVTGVVLGLSAGSAVSAELERVHKTTASESFARVNFHPACEAAINEQIK